MKPEIKKEKNHRAKRKTRKLRWIFLRAFLLFFLFLGRLVPRKVLLLIGNGLGRLAYLLFPSERRKTIKNLKTAFPKKNNQQISCLAKEVFINIGMNFTELIWLPRLNEKNVDKLVNFEGLEILDELKKTKGPVLIVTGHIGNWELMAAAAAMKGFPTSVVARRIDDDYLNDTIVRLRRKWKVKTILRDEQHSSREILSMFKNGGFLATLMDQDTKIESVFVDFFNRKTYTPLGPAAISLRSGCRVVAAYIHRNGYSRHKVKLKYVTLIVSTGDRERDIVNRTQQFTSILEEAIREHPEQWVWMHKRWKTQRVDLNGRSNNGG